MNNFQSIYDRVFHQSKQVVDHFQQYLTGNSQGPCELMVNKIKQ